MIQPLRILLTLLSTFAFLASGVEMSLPEVHDDVSSEVHFTGADPAHGSCGELQRSATPCSHSDQGGPVSHHGPHADHCSHYHRAAQPAAGVAVMLVSHVATPVSVATSLASFLSPPQLRPPIV